MGREGEFNLENVEAQMRKGVLDFLILLIIAQKEVYASEILTTLKKSDFVIVEGTLYPLLSRLKRAELVEYSWKESKSGPPRKYYKLTVLGEKTLTQLKDSWASFDTSINRLIKAYEKSH